MNELVLDVTAEDIAMGVRGSCGCCPVALAAKRVMPFANYVEVGWWRLNFTTTFGWNISLPLPAEATAFISEFDRGDCKPTPVRIGIPLALGGPGYAFLVEALAQGRNAPTHGATAMSKTITVDVTREDIEAGVPRDCHLCPIALALRRLVATDDSQYDSFIDVGGCLIWLGTREINAPEVASDFIERFDRSESTGEVEPFSFPLDIPDDIPLVESPR